MITYKAVSDNNTVILYNSMGDRQVVSNLPEALDFLCKYRNQGFICFWDLDHSLATILSILPRNQLTQMLSYWELDNLPDKSQEQKDTKLGILRIMREWMSVWEINYKEDRSLRIVKDYNWKGCTWVFNLKQFFADDVQEPELVEMAKMGQTMVDAVNGMRGMQKGGVDMISSAGAIAVSLLNSLDLPADSNLGEGYDMIGEAYRYCQGKPWQETHRLGYFPAGMCTDYDTTRAHSYQLASLIDFRKGKWYISPQPPTRSFYGVAFGHIYIEAPVSPIMYRTAGGHFNPVGDWWDWITKEEIETIYRWKLGTFRAQKGMWFVPTEKENGKPLRGLMHYLYDLRTHPILGSIAKKVANSVWGLMLYERGTYKGKYHNPTWGSVVEANERCSVANFVYAYDLQDKLVNISTDGCLAITDMQLPPDNNNGIGKWRSEPAGEVLSVSSTFVFHGQARPNGITLTEALESVRSQPQESSWQLGKTRLLSIPDLQHTAYRPRIGHKEGFGIAPSANLDRKFKPMPALGSDLLTNVYNSVPWKIHSQAQESEVVIHMG